MKIDREKTLVYNPEYRGVRLDIYAKNENEIYDVEMQLKCTGNLLKRSRYYHDEMDMEALGEGMKDILFS